MNQRQRKAFIHRAISIVKSFETYRFKARLTKAARKALDEALEVNRLLYNAANEARRYALQLVKS